MRTTLFLIAVGLTYWRIIAFSRRRFLDNGTISRASVNEYLIRQARGQEPEA